MNLNRDDKRRNEILERYLESATECYSGGIIYFNNAPTSVIKQLFDENFIDPDDKQNNAPTAKELYDFMVRNITVVASGYIVSPSRDDYRVTIDSIKGSVSSRSECTCDLINTTRNADDLTVTPRGNLIAFDAWWD